ncbi:MAG TPA: hypothetical protein VMW24_23695 [Sedimentisphaerales bacterium]|nr:hypothetical protein [Sedimentisphaerales bacterium]
MVVIDGVGVGDLDHADGLVDAWAVDVFAQQVVIAVVFAEHAVRAVRACARRRPERSRGTVRTVAIRWIRRAHHKPSFPLAGHTMLTGRNA